MASLLTTSVKTLHDRRERPLRDIRLSVIERCNLRCRYCLPAEVFGPDYAFTPERDLLSADHLVKITASARRLGAQKLRLTGGEPLLRRDLPALIGRFAAQGWEDLALTTNGLALGRLARPLAEAGLQRINVSLDALDPAVLERMSGRRVDPGIILRGIDAARTVGLPVKVNTVLQRGWNDDQLLPLAHWARQEGVTLRFIEFMDVGNQNAWDRTLVIPGAEVRARLAEIAPLEAVPPSDPSDVARRYRYADLPVEVGFIDSISAPFCGDCSRMRVTAKGEVLTCLFAAKGLDFRRWIEDPDTDEAALAERFARLWRQRDDAYSETRGLEAPHAKAEMWTLGG